MNVSEAEKAVEPEPKEQSLPSVSVAMSESNHEDRIDEPVVSTDPPPSGGLSATEGTAEMAESNLLQQPDQTGVVEDDLTPLPSVNSLPLDSETTDLRSGSIERSPFG